MNKALLLSAVALALAACSRVPPPAAPPAAAPGSGTTVPAASGIAPPALPPDERILYYPSRDRVLTTGDQSSDDMQWKPVGIGFPGILGRILHGLVLADSELTDRDGNPKGVRVSAGTRVKVEEAGDWVNDGSGFRRLLRVQAPDGGSRGWIRAAAVALILAESGGVQAGVVLRKVVIGGGESEFNVLVVADPGGVTLFDTSYLPFPDEFHPSGVLDVSLDDVNADSRAEVIVEAETILSLRYLGATPVRWKAWLRRADDGALVSIFRYNTSFGSDAGYSYTATDRFFDSSGAGMRDLVRVDTDYTVVSGPEEFRTRTVSFYPWNGSQFRHAVLQDLPKLGTVTAEQAELREEPREDSPPAAALARGDQLYVFDRSDSRQSRDDAASWWYRAVSRAGVEGWISGTLLDLSWIDPMKTNRAAFLAQN